MTAYQAADENGLGDADDWDDPDAGGELDDTDGEPTVPCPYCRREILEDTPRCPYCERYLSEEDRDAPRKPAWIILTALLCLGAAVWWIVAAK